VIASVGPGYNRKVRDFGNRKSLSEEFAGLIKVQGVFVLDWIDKSDFDGQVILATTWEGMCPLSTAPVMPKAVIPLRGP